LTLVSPSGLVITPAVAAEDPDIEFQVLGDVIGFLWEGYFINTSEAGSWTLVVSAPSVVTPSASEGYFLMGWMTDTKIEMEVETDRSSYQAGDPMVVRATLLDGTLPVTNSLVEARIVGPDDTFLDIALLDDGIGDDVAAGDGIYSGSFTSTNQTGLYRLVVSAEGQPPRVFSRSSLLIAPVGASASRFNGVFSDFGADTDGDGLFDELVVEAGVYITDSTSYRVSGSLVDQAGKLIGNSNVTTVLEPGVHTISFRFDGWSIYKNGADGPFTLSRIFLVEEPGIPIVILDEQLNAHRTANYSLSQFQHPHILLPGTSSDQGVDIDGNGLFDTLNINLDVNVLNSGFYNWSGDLRDSNGTKITFAINSGFLDQGSNAVEFAFDGEAIGRNGVDGPYLLTTIGIYGAGDSAIPSQEFPTTPYRANQFKGFSESETSPKT